MRAAVLKEIGKPLEIEDVPAPEPGPSDLILKVKACGICGTDLHWSESHEDKGWRVLPSGAVMGHEFAGEVIEVGRDVRGKWKVGDKVTALPPIGCGRCAECRAGRPFRCAEVQVRANPELTGAYAEYTRVGTHETLVLPSDVGFGEGALVEPLAVGLNAANRGRIGPEDNVLIIGGGPVGLSVAVWCRFLGARNIVVSDLIGARAERAVDFGASAAIDASREDVDRRFRQLTGGGPDVVFDAVGVPGSLQLAVDHAQYHSRVVVVGLCMAGDHLYPAQAIVKEIDLNFAFVYRKKHFEIVLDMLAANRVDAEGLITDRVGFDDFSTAFEALKRPTGQIKVVLEPD